MDVFVVGTDHRTEFHLLLISTNVDECKVEQPKFAQEVLLRIALTFVQLWNWIKDSTTCSTWSRIVLSSKGWKKELRLLRQLVQKKLVIHTGNVFQLHSPIQKTQCSFIDISKCEKLDICETSWWKREPKHVFLPPKTNTESRFYPQLCYDPLHLS